jgi:hypothetical protein
MKRDAEFFEGREATLVYIAKRLSVALALESELTSAGVDYAVEADHYRGGFLFPSDRVGAFFYVAADAEQAARDLMLSKGYKPHEAGR